MSEHDLDPAAFAELLCGYCLEVEPGQIVLVRSTTLAAPLLLELQRAILERDAWPLLRVEIPGATRGFYTHARDRHLDDVSDLAYTEAKKVKASLGHPGARRRARARRASTPSASRATPARGGRSARRR